VFLTIGFMLLPVPLLAVPRAVRHSATPGTCHGVGQFAALGATLAVEVGKSLRVFSYVRRRQVAVVRLCLHCSMLQ